MLKVLAILQLGVLAAGIAATQIRIPGPEGLIMVGVIAFIGLVYTAISTALAAVVLVKGVK